MLGIVAHFERDVKLLQGFTPRAIQFSRGTFVGGLYQFLVGWVERNFTRTHNPRKPRTDKNTLISPIP